MDTLTSQLIDAAGQLGLAATDVLLIVPVAYLLWAIRASYLLTRR